MPPYRLEGAGRWYAPVHREASKWWRAMGLRVGRGFAPLPPITRRTHRHIGRHRRQNVSRRSYKHERSFRAWSRGSETKQVQVAIAGVIRYVGAGYIASFPWRRRHTPL